MMDEPIRKQNHGTNDLKYLIDEARSFTKESMEFVEMLFSSFKQI